MRIGLTYDLRSEYLAAGHSREATAEFDRDDTIAALEETIRSLGHEVSRIGNAFALVGKLARKERWELVFNIAEGLRGIGREALVPALLDLYEVPYVFSDPLVLALSLHKGMTKRVVRDAGLPTPDFAVAARPEDLEGIPFPPPYFAKPVAEGTSKGISAESVIRRREDLLPLCRRLWSRFRQPVLVEEHLAGREFTVGIVGTGEKAEALGALEISALPDADADAYTYRNKEEYEKLVAYRLADPAAPEVGEGTRIALGAWRLLGCRDGGRVDIRCNREGKPFFLEVNPLAGLHPVHSDLPILAGKLGMSYRDLIARILASALAKTEAGHD